MTLPVNPPISLLQINAEWGFAPATPLLSYRGRTWWKDDGSSGTFPTGDLSMFVFLGKRSAPPGTVPPGPGPTPPIPPPDGRLAFATGRTQQHWDGGQWTNLGLSNDIQGGISSVQVYKEPVVYITVPGQGTQQTGGNYFQFRFKRAANVSRVTLNGLDLSYLRVEGGYYLWQLFGPSDTSSAPVVVYA